MEVFQLRIILKITIFASIALNPAEPHKLGTMKKKTNLESSYFVDQREYPRDCSEVICQCSNQNSSGVILIKPDGCDDPLEVFCQNDVDGSGWTLIQRRMDGSINFNRSWSDYKEGFGFINSEFWIGNEKLSFLTNQKKYQLRIDWETAEGTSFYVTYDAFRISDEFSNFRLVRVGRADTNIETCPTNMVFTSCSCQTSCSKPDLCEDKCTPTEGYSCICPAGFYIQGDECVPPQKCRCYLTGIGVLTDGESHLNDNCTERCSCEAGTLSCDSSLRCNSNADCEERNGTRGCYCRDGFQGDGLVCVGWEHTDCYDVYISGSTDDGVYTIKPTGWPGSEFEVYCEMSNGGGWTVFQRRQDGSIDFYRDWISYRNGFPDTVSGELWLGNEKLHYLTNQRNYKMRIDLVNRDGVSYNLNYDAFRIGNEGTKYRIETLGNFTGNIGYDHMDYHRGRAFSTYDDDNDSDNYSCASHYHGAWWYGSCYRSSLNGDYSSGTGTGVALYNGNEFTEYSLRFTEMKVRPV